MNGRERECDSKKVLKLLLSIFNVLFWFSGPGVLGLGIWLYLVVQELDVALEHAQFVLPAYLLLTTGGAIIIFGIIGCMAIFNENRCLLGFYCMCLFAVFATEVAACLKSFLMYDGIESQVMYRLNISMRYNYIYNEEVTRSLDTLHKQYSCCGIYNHTDWLNTNYNLQTRSLVSSAIQPYPASCCVVTSGCNLTLAENSYSDIYEDGCLYPIVDQLQFIIRIVGWSSFASAALLVIGGVMVYCFRLAVRP